MTPLQRFLVEAEARCKQGALSRPTEDKFNVYHPAIQACHRDLPAALALLRAFAAVVREAREADPDWEDLHALIGEADAAVAECCGEETNG